MSKIWEKTKEFMGFVEEEEDDYPGRVMPKKPLVNIPMGNQKSISTSQIRVIEPRDADQSLDIANALREGSPVIISLKYLEADESKRLFDFICGTTYAINGNFRKLGDNILLFTPEHIGIVDADAENSFNEIELNDPKKNIGRVTEY